MSFERMLSDGAQRMGDLLLDILETGLSRLAGMVGAGVAAVTNRESSVSRESVSTPMVDGERTRAPEAPNVPNRVRAQGTGQAIAISHDEHEEEVVQPPKVLAIKNPQDLSFLKDMAKNDQALYAMAEHSPANNVQPAMTAGKIREMGGMGMPA